jgi:hypothetical protein
MKKITILFLCNIITWSIVFSSPGNAIEEMGKHTAIVLREKPITCPKASEVKENIKNAKANELTLLKGEVFASIKDNVSFPLKIYINAESDRWTDLDVAKEVKGIAAELEANGFSTELEDDTAQGDVILTVDIK